MQIRKECTGTYIGSLGKMIFAGHRFLQAPFFVNFVGCQSVTADEEIAYVW